MGTQGGHPPWALGALALVGVGDMDGTGPCALESRGCGQQDQEEGAGLLPHPSGILQEPGSKPSGPSLRTQPV